MECMVWSAASLGVSDLWSVWYGLMLAWPGVPHIVSHPPTCPEAKIIVSRLHDF